MMFCCEFQEETRKAERTAVNGKSHSKSTKQRERRRSWRCDAEFEEQIWKWGLSLEATQATILQLAWIHSQGADWAQESDEHSTL